MNVQWRKLGSLMLAVGASVALGVLATAARAQTADRPADGWYDKSANESDADARPSQPSNEQPSRPTEAPRAGSPGYAPSYQQPQGNQNRPDYNRSPSDRGYRQSSASSQNGQYNGPHDTTNGQHRRPVRPAGPAQYYPNSRNGAVAGPYDGYPPARARTVAYRRQDVEYADDQPNMAPGTTMSGQPSISMQPNGPPMTGGPIRTGPPGEWGEPEEGGCANGSCGAGGCAEGCCDGSCSSCECGESCWPRNACRTFSDWCRQDAFRDFAVYAGVEGFKGPIDLGENGDFGFHEGANWGMPLWGCSGVGFQVGAEIDHSDLAPNATVFGDHRTQYFITSGVFYRPTRECGWQGGVVWDYQDDEFYDAVTVGQIRGNLSYVVDWSEFGFEFAAGVHSDTFRAPINSIAAGPGVAYSPVDLYTLYYGRRLCNGGEVKVFGGLADGLGGIVGADLDIAISDSFSLEGDFAYLIADKAAAGEIPGESANIAFSIVWHPGCHARDTFDSAYRPLFNVADNSSFIVNRR